MTLAIPPAKEGQIFLLSPNGRDCEWVDPENVPARCAGWTDVTALSMEDLQIVAAPRMQQNPQWGL